MRIDIFLSKLGIIKRRTIAKEMAEGGLIKLNNKTAKPSSNVTEGDIIKIAGSRPATYEILKMPSKNVKREDREKYYRVLSGSN